MDVATVLRYNIISGYSAALQHYSNTFSLLIYWCRVKKWVENIYETIFRRTEKKRGKKIQYIYVYIYYNAFSGYLNLGSLLCIV